MLAPAAPAGLAGPVREASPPPPEAEAEGQTDQPDEPALAEPFAKPVGPPQLRPMKKGRRLVKKSTAPKLQISPEQRLLILDTWRRSGLPAADFSALVGIPNHTLYSWKKRFEQEGPAGLMDRPRGGRKGSKLPELTKRTILMLKESNPDWGCQRISDMLVRGPALPASPTAVARVLKEAGYELEEVPTRRHPDQVRRFERARSNQLWQTDLFTFVLKRQYRGVYLVAFMDDHSRFLTGFGPHASQPTALVLEVRRTAISSSGGPEEMLTDNDTPAQPGRLPILHLAGEERVFEGAGKTWHPPGGGQSSSSSDAGQDRTLLGDAVARVHRDGRHPGLGRRTAEDRSFHRLLPLPTHAPGPRWVGAGRSLLRCRQ